MGRGTPDAVDRLCHLVQGCVSITPTPSVGSMSAEGVMLCGLGSGFYSQRCAMQYSMAFPKSIRPRERV